MAGVFTLIISLSFIYTLYLQIFSTNSKKTLIFAKDDNHATEIVDVAKDVFKSEFEKETIPEKFVQKIYKRGQCFISIALTVVFI